VCDITGDSPIAACVTPALVVARTVNLSAHNPLDWAVWGSAASGVNARGPRALLPFPGAPPDPATQSRYSPMT
jgi:hypothetical protein